MKVLLPNTTFLNDITKMAPRPGSLNDKVVGFLDGWGCRREDGSFGMYPLMEEMRQLLEERYELGGHIWFHKPNISKVAPPEQMNVLIEQADVVINGQCA
jgi:hypothetical protein